MTLIFRNRDNCKNEKNYCIGNTEFSTPRRYFLKLPDIYVQTTINLEVQGKFPNKKRNKRNAPSYKTYTAFSQ